MTGLMAAGVLRSDHMVHSADMELADEEIRLLGCLIEKERATPDQYPLTTNALRTACNQKSNRDPVVDYDTAVIERTMLSLRDMGYARTVTGSGRTVKHKQVLDEALGLTNAEISILGVLMLRGAQTPNELRTRTERLHGFEDNDAVERTLGQLTVGDRPLVVCIGKQSGQREARWVHLLDGKQEPDSDSGRPPAPSPDHAAASGHETSPSMADEAPGPMPDRAGAIRPSPPPPVAPEPQQRSAAPGSIVSAGAPARASRIAELEEEVATLRDELGELRSRFDDLAQQLGIVDGGADG